MKSKIKIRLHRAGLDDSLRTTEEIDNSMNSLLEFINKSIHSKMGKISTNQIIIKEYHLSDDGCSYIVTILGWGVLGFCSDIPADYVESSQ